MPVIPTLERQRQKSPEAGVLPELYKRERKQVKLILEISKPVIVSGMLKQENSHMLEARLAYSKFRAS